MPPIVWIPGHLCGRWLYAPQIDAVEAEHLIADVTEDDTLGAMAERLLAAAPERFLIAGLSMGAMVAMEAIAAAPDRVAGALLMDTDPTEARAKEIAWRAEMGALVETEGVGAFVRPFVRSFFAHDEDVGGALADQVRDHMSAVEPGVFARQGRALSARRRVLDAISGYDGPVEVVWGAEDRLCPPMLHRELVETLKAAEGTEETGCGHLLTLERPAEAAAALVRLKERAG